MKTACMSRVRHFGCAAQISGALLAASFGAPVLAVEGTVHLEPREDGTVFGYRGNRGPAFWGDLDPAWSECKEGSAQSPVDLGQSRRRNLPGPEFHYQRSRIEVLNNGHTIEFKYDPGSQLRLGEDVFELTQFHFHTPSEHTFAGGANFPVEMHLVHSDPGGRLAVVGLMLIEGEHNPALPFGRRFGQLMPREEGVTYELAESVDVGALLPESRASFRYRGSLTTPPCSELVMWLVLEQPIELSGGQLHELREALNQLKYGSGEGNNNRPTQPLNGRSVSYDAGSP